MVRTLLVLLPLSLSNGAVTPAVGGEPATTPGPRETANLGEEADESLGVSCDVNLGVSPGAELDEKLDELLARFRRGEAGAAQALADLGEPAVAGVAALLLDEKLPSVTRFGAANVLGDSGSARAVEPLLQALAADDVGVRRCSALALGKLGDERARKPLLELAAKDPYVYRDEAAKKDRYLVREDAVRALALLDGEIVDAAGLVKEPELLLDDAAVPPPSPVRVKLARLPFPFPGDFARQHVYNNYQQATDSYVHAGLDILNPAGTEVRAVDGGKVVLVATNYPDWKTHHFFVVQPNEGVNEGWCYTHLDPDSYRFEVGATVRRGDVLGKLVDFSVGKHDGVDHLHLNYVRYTEKEAGKYDTTSLVDPLLYFASEDRVAPRILPVLRFVKAGTLREFAAAADAVPIVSGNVDVIAGISDEAGTEHSCNWMAAVVTLEIRGAKSPPWRKLVLDQRGEIAHATAAPVLYLSHAQKRRWIPAEAPGLPVHFVIATHSDGDGVLEPADRLHGWNTKALDADGNPRFPDGDYEVVVRAWDGSLNRGERTARVRVKN